MKIAPRAAILWAALAQTAAVIAQAPSPWVGQRVVTKTPTPLRVGTQVVDEDKTFRVYTVTHATAGWLHLEAGSAAGWVPEWAVVAFDRAIDHYTAEIRANPGSAYYYTKRAIIWKKKGELDIAIADLNEAIRIDPKSAVAYSVRGNAWNDKKEYDKAIADLNEAIRIDPKDAYAYNNRGNAWSYKKEYDRAMADYNEAIRIDPKYALPYYNRGNAWCDKKEYDKAIADYNEAIRIDPKYADAYINRGVAWYDKKEYDKAIADYNEAIRIDPKYAPAYNNRAWLRATCPDPKFRDGTRAREDATRACELTGHKDAYHLGTLAAACAEAGDFDKAAEWQARANAAYVDPEDARKGLERLKLYRDRKPYRETE